MQCIHDVLHAENPRVRMFRYAYELYRTEDVRDLAIVLCADESRLLDRRLYNAPEDGDVAVIVPDGNASCVSCPRDIVLRTRSNAVQRIDETNSTYEPLHYVLLFPRGGFGWHPGYRDVNGRPVTMMGYASHRLCVRRMDASNPHHFGRLFLQYVTDMWVRMEQWRLRYFETDEFAKKLRIEQMQVGLCCCGVGGLCFGS